jgi:tellurite resistance protein TerC
MITAWLLFIAFIVVLLVIDLGVLHRTPHAVGFRESLAWSALSLTLGVAFSGVVYVGYEHQVWGLGTHVDPVDGAVNSGAAAVEKYLTGYLVEKSLSIDNIFVMSTIFTALAVPALHQHRVLFWGVIGALAGIVEKSRYLEPALAVVLLIVGGKMRAAEWLKEMLGDHFNLALLLAVAASRR